jgi:hypothetical protein
LKVFYGFTHIFKRFIAINFELHASRSGDRTLAAVVGLSRSGAVRLPMFADQARLADKPEKPRIKYS